MERLELLKQLSFGTQVAEEEVARLQEYFVRTDQWSRIINGEVDIIRGEKGSGKSAIYLLLEKNKDELFDRRILIVTGENPRGATVFKDLILDPPTGEQEFIILWKLYILTIICHELREFGIQGSDIGSIFGALEDAKLLERERNLAGILRAAQNLARRLLGMKAIEYELVIDQQTGTPSGIIGRISLAEPTSGLRNLGVHSLDGMLSKVNAALATSGYRLGCF